MTRKIVKISQNIRKLRQKNSMTQDELASKIRKTRQTICSWETEKQVPSIYDLCDICDLFKVNIETMIYGDVSEPIVSNVNTNNQIYFNEDNDRIAQYPYYIDSVREKGFHYIFDTDLRDFWFIAYDIVDILIIASELKKRGFNVIELFGNGFSVFINSNKEALKFQSALYDIRDDFIHHDNESIIKKKEDLSKNIDIAINDAIDTVFLELYGKNIDKFSYYWTDEDENIRGYADTKEECVLQAKEQECLKYRIIDAE